MLINLLQYYIMNPLKQKIVQNYYLNEGKYDEHDRILLENTYDLMEHKYINHVALEEADADLEEADTDLFTFDSSTYFKAITNTIFCLFD